MTETADQALRDWLFRSITFEADSQRFRDAGIIIGADSTAFEVQLFQETLAPFPLHTRNEALRMSRLYALIYAFENSVRDLIKEKLQQNIGPNWWDTAVPDKIRRHCVVRKADAEKNTWLQGQRIDLISFADFGHLSDIIIHNWTNFSDLFPNQHWLKQRLDELEKVRNFIAHNRLLLDAEFQRIEMYVADWNAQVGI